MSVAGELEAKALMSLYERDVIKGELLPRLLAIAIDHVSRRVNLDTFAWTAVNLLEQWHFRTYPLCLGRHRSHAS